MTQVFVQMIEPVFALLQAQVECVIGDSVELLKPALGIAPETINAVDMMLTSHEFVFAVIDSYMLTIANIS